MALDYEAIGTAINGEAGYLAALRRRGLGKGGKNSCGGKGSKGGKNSCGGKGGRGGKKGK
jgi:hypothetical protein